MRTRAEAILAGRIDTRLNELGIALPEAPAPAANYVPFVHSGALVFISGQVPFEDGELRHRGRLGAQLDVEAGREAARCVARNVLAVLRRACGGDLDRVRRCVQLQGFVLSTPDFDRQPAVLDGASELMVDVFGDAGRHARFAVGVSALPFGVAVEIAAVFEIGG